MQINKIITAVAVVSTFAAGAVAVSKTHEVEANRALAIAECEYERFEQDGERGYQHTYTCEEIVDQTFADWQEVYNKNKEATLDDLL